MLYFSPVTHWMSQGFTCLTKDQDCKKLCYWKKRQRVFIFGKEVRIRIEEEQWTIKNTSNFLSFFIHAYTNSINCYLEFEIYLFVVVKASAHSFKRFTSPPFLKSSFSLYALITSDEWHAWFHLNAASPAARNTEQVNITKKNLVLGKIRTTNTARPPAYNSTIINARPQLDCYEWRILSMKYIYTIYK